MNPHSLARLPIFRSLQQARILTELWVVATEAISLRELASRTETSSGGVHKEVGRLEAAGLISSRRAGRTRLVSANRASPFYTDLRGLLLRAFGPQALLTEALQGLPGIKRAFIYGSWAASELSSQAPVPRDIDVMVLGDPDVDVVYAAIAEVEARVGRPVNISIYSEEEWQESTTGFAEMVRSSPQLELLE
ncbi:MAG TPA: ArsR family transcriptional regulator [Acidimicrobiia bacterium]